MTTFQIATLLVPVVVGVVGNFYLQRASVGLNRKYGRDPK